jgi:predicted O-methyltransferase YrrM
MNFELRKYKYTQTWFVNSDIQKNLLKHLNKSEKRRVLEIGCFEGLSAACFSDNILDHPESTMECVDPFLMEGNDHASFIDNKTEEMFDFNMKTSKNSNKITKYSITSDEFFEKLDPQKMYDFIYIDGCHLPNYIKRDMENSWSHLVKGGVMWMDDYLGGGGTCRVPMDNFLDMHIGEYQILFKNYQLGIRKMV